MGHQPEYKCTRCGNKNLKRDELIAVKVSFVTLGSDGQTIKSRTPDWLCFPCLNEDVVWNMEEYDSPGLRTAEEQLEAETPNLDKKYADRQAAGGS